MKRIKRIAVLCLAVLLMLAGLSGCAAGGDEAAAQEEEPTAAEESAVLPEEDASDFVVLSEAVPDVILEIRY